MRGEREPVPADDWDRVWHVVLANTKFLRHRQEVVFDEPPVQEVIFPNANETAGTVPYGQSEADRQH